MSLFRSSLFKIILIITDLNQVRSTATPTVTVTISEDSTDEASSADGASSVAVVGGTLSVLCVLLGLLLIITVALLVLICVRYRQLSQRFSQFNNPDDLKGNLNSNRNIMHNGGIQSFTVMYTMTCIVCMCDPVR